MKLFSRIICFSLFLGVFFVSFVRWYDVGFGWTIFLLLIAVALLFSLEKALSSYPLRSHREAYSLLFSGCALALSHSIWDQKHFVVLNVLVSFPLIVAGVYSLRNDMHHIAQHFFSFWFSGILEYIRSCFKYFWMVYDNIPSLLSFRHRWANPQMRRSILIGFLLVLIVILPLLSSADPIFADYLDMLWNTIAYIFPSSLSWDWLSNYIAFHKILLCIIIACMTGGAMLLITYRPEKYVYDLWLLWKIFQSNIRELVQRLWITHYTIIVTMITVIYLLFAIVQIKYLFLGGQLPVWLTYSEYAVQGFRQLLAILSINLLIFVLSPHTSAKRSYSFSLNAILFGLSCIIWMSCLMRLQLYIDVYQLTWMRLLPWTFSILLIILLCLVYLGTQKSSLSRVSLCFYGVLLRYVLLNLVGVDWIIAKYNVLHTEEGKVDMSYLLNELSYDVFFVLDEKLVSESGYDKNIERKRQEQNISSLLYSQEN